MPILRRAYVPAALAWIAVLPLGDFAATREHATFAVHLFAFAVYGVGSLLCHQRPERSFHLWAAQLPVCARCTGIYVGAAAAALVARSPEGSRSIAERVARSPEGSRSIAGTEREASAERINRQRLWMVLAALPTAVTLVYEWTTGVMPSNWTRFAAGLPLGIAASWLVLRGSKVE